MKLTLVITGKAATARPRIRQNGHGMFNTPEVKRWKQNVKEQAFLQTRDVSHLLPIKAGVPVRADYNFYLPWQKATPKKLAHTNGEHTQKPDLKNLLSHTEDALSEAGIWTDDNQVDTITLQKWRCPRGDERVECVISW